MKKIFLTAVVLVSGAQLCAVDAQFVNGLRYAATPEAVQLVDSVQKTCMGDEFQAEISELYKEHARQAISCLVRHLKKTLSPRELQEVAMSLQDLGEWYAGYSQLISDKEGLETQAGQEAMLGYQIELMQLMQKPLFAAVLVRLMDIYAHVQMNPESLEGVTKKCGTFVAESLNHLQVELQA